MKFMYIPALLSVLSIILLSVDSTPVSTSNSMQINILKRNEKATGLQANSSTPTPPVRAGRPVIVPDNPTRNMTLPPNKQPQTPTQPPNADKSRQNPTKPPKECNNSTTGKPRTQKPGPTYNTTKPGKPNTGNKPSIPNNGTKAGPPYNGSKPTSPTTGTKPTIPHNGTKAGPPYNGSKPASPNNGTKPCPPTNGPSYNGTKPNAPNNGTKVTPPYNGTRPGSPNNGTNSTSPTNGTNSTSPDNGKNSTTPNNTTNTINPSNPLNMGLIIPTMVKEVAKQLSGAVGGGPDALSKVAATGLAEIAKQFLGGLNIQSG
ncbi:hypothetical protein BKA69DRAFT_1084360 [Paraphysoderma sedebokerense]|nr:hypothetical protein BKA69DRAFT_1084360 [Paraphysoderma sedebokerense]